MKVKHADHTSRHQSRKEEKICKDYHKKKTLLKQKTPTQTKKTKTIHIDAYICINVKKKTLTP